tara:strand:+ start:1351 stop:1701 length:351 start_codon:yes stop_codon:yes gene_type:complete
MEQWLPNDLIDYIVRINVKEHFQLVMTELLHTVHHSKTGFEESWNDYTQELQRAEHFEITYYDHESKLKKCVRYHNGGVDPHGLWKCVLYVANITDESTTVLFNSPIDNKTAIYSA